MGRTQRVVVDVEDTESCSRGEDTNSCDRGEDTESCGRGEDTESCGRWGGHREL